MTNAEIDEAVRRILDGPGLDALLASVQAYAREKAAYNDGIGEDKRAEDWRIVDDQIQQVRAADETGYH
jgi:hypothetical protein